MRRVRIAIIGGGLAGATLANALTRNRRIEVQIYESAPDFSGQSGVIELSHLALQAMEGIIPSAVEMLKAKVGASVMDEAHVVLGFGSDRGPIIRDLGVRGLVMDRPTLLRELLSSLPRKALHVNKKLKSLEQTASGPVKLTFEDGEVVKCDAVIGADGTFSRVRDYVLQDDAKKYAASPAGWSGCTVSVPFSKAKAALEEEGVEIDMNREYQWMGIGLYVMYAPAADRTQVQCVLVSVEQNTPMDQKQPVVRGVLEDNITAGWINHHAAQAIIRLIKLCCQLMLKSDNLQGYSHWEHKSTPTYSNGRVCIIGDAAHTTNLWQGAGGGMALEDAFILGSLLHNIKYTGNIDAIFKAFDTVRRPRCQRIIDTSRETGELCRNHVGLNTEQIRDLLGPLSDHIGALDLEAHKMDAFHELRGNTLGEAYSPHTSLNLML
ncbi:FAD/NAD(P)-binding domain-containing protein [Hypoxylon sp. FL0890]|nr:FAD/NAD(P)-binding domain-containing protein [Hypoxylon sp. FL0890]